MVINYGRILPVLFLEFLAISLARSLFPGLLMEAFGRYSYVALGIVETAKGLLAFVSSPLFGRLSDEIGEYFQFCSISLILISFEHIFRWMISRYRSLSSFMPLSISTYLPASLSHHNCRIGRKYCLLVTVVGTTLPVFIMAFSVNMYLYSIALAISGFFSATFALTFAYISDCVDKKSRAPAYGMALATFGVSFCIGPATGSYIAVNFGNRAVFMCSLVLTVLNVFYILLYLPETSKRAKESAQSYSQKFERVVEYLPESWNITETFRVFNSDPFMGNLAIIVFVYYTAVWAMVSTLMIYITKNLHFDPVQIGWLLTAYGVATVVSEGVLVRIIVPRIGELNSMRLGLMGFCMQTIIIAMASSAEWVFMSVLFAMLANLVYPSISSLVSKVVSEEMQGEAQGALNGIRALTEGFGPLFFGAFMTLFENTPQPGAPYLIAAFLSFWALLHCFELPDLAPQPELLTAKYDARRKGFEEGAGLLDGDDDDSIGDASASGGGIEGRGGDREIDRAGDGWGEDDDSEAPSISFSKRKR